jgi:serine/threonine protein kinase
VIQTNALLPCGDAEAEAVVGRIADEFTERLNSGERPDIEEYARRHPQLADLLREVLPSLELLRGQNRAEPTDNHDAVGTLGDYRLLRVVGRGGMGVVYEAEQRPLGRRVAVKVLPFAATLDAYQQQRFESEARTAAGLHHTHIVPVYAMGTDRGVHYFAMQFIDGRPLSDVIARLRAGDRAALVPNEPDHVRAAARLCVQAAEALAYAHQLGVVHRDVKPGNLLLDEAGHLWLTDFGLARCGSDPGLTGSGDVVGTLRYMSPEHLGGGGQADARGDIYSLGATLHELLTLEPCYAGRDRAELLRQILATDPKPLRRLNPAVPGDLETIVLKAMAREPERRYGSAAELADDLRRFLEHRPIKARRPSLLVRITKFTRRHRAAAAAAAIVLVFAVVGLGISTLLVWQEKERTKQALDASEANRRRAEASVETALRGATQVLMPLEDERLTRAADGAELRQALIDRGASFFRRFIHAEDPDPVVRSESARACHHLAEMYCAHQQVAPALAALHEEAAILDRLASEHPEEPAYRIRMADAYALEAALYVSTRRPSEARDAFTRVAEQLRLALPLDGGPETLNTYAWFLADCPVADLRNPELAVELARRAIDLAPLEGRIWNTLGVAHYRAGDFPSAIAALKRSMELRSGGNAWDWFFLAMATSKLGERPAATAWRAKAVRAMDEAGPLPADLVRYRSEAESLLGPPPDHNKPPGPMKP